MRHSLLLFACAAGLLTNSACSPDQPASTAENAAQAVDSTLDSAPVVVDTVRFHTEAGTTAARVADDLSLTDTVVVRKIGTVYHTRAHRLADAATRYAADTTGRYAALRAANDEADRALQAALRDEARYQVYQQNRAAYYQGTPYTVVVVENAAPKPAGPAVVKMEREADGDVKIKYADGSKVKVEADGDRKVKRADGVKIKTDEDGRKVKQ